jgi:hypothetical protein
MFVWAAGGKAALGGAFQSRSSRVALSVGQAGKKFDDRGADFCQGALAGPMATAGKHLDVAKVWHVLFHVGNVLGCSGKRDDQLVIAGNVQSRHRDRDAFEGRNQFPIAVNVAIIVERPANAATREFADIRLEKRFPKS